MPKTAKKPKPEPATEQSSLKVGDRVFHPPDGFTYNDTSYTYGTVSRIQVDGIAWVQCAPDAVTWYHPGKLEKFDFIEGDRVQWNRNGERLEGVIVGLGQAKHTIQVPEDKADQIKHINGDRTPVTFVEPDSLTLVKSASNLVESPEPEPAAEAPRPKPFEIKILKLSQIKRDRALQKRAHGTDNATVERYRELMQEGVALPPPKVMLVAGDYFLYDGWHTYSAATQCGMEEIECQVSVGTYADAEWAACAANSDHGLQRSNEDIRVACLAAIRLHLEENPGATNFYRKLARHIGCDHKTVAKWHEHLIQTQTGEFPTRKPGESPEGHTLEELVELYKPIGEFRATGDRKFRYELEVTGRSKTHYFRGLDEAFKESEKLLAGYQSKPDINAEAENQASKTGLDEAALVSTSAPNSAPLEAILEGGDDRGEERSLLREVSPEQWDEWRSLPDGEIREEYLNFQGWITVGTQKFPAGTPASYRSYEFYLNRPGNCIDLAYRDKTWYSDEDWSYSLDDFDQEISVASVERYVKALIDELEGAIASIHSRQPESPQKQKRVEHDYYPTPKEITQVLLDHVKIEGRVLEPCAGAGAISSFFYGSITNDPFPSEGFQPDYCADATSQAFWDAIESEGGVDWVVTNPPYLGDTPIQILEKAYKTARLGVAFLLRINFLEPCENRAQWLKKHCNQLSDLIILNPRPKFRADVNGGDNVTVAWMVWEKGYEGGTNIVFANWR